MTANFGMYEKDNDIMELVQGIMLLLTISLYPVFLVYYIYKRRKKLATQWA